MKKWVSLLIREINLNHIQIPQIILDKSLYLFSNLEDFEQKLEEYIQESENQFFIASFYYQIWFFHYMSQISLYNNYYYNLCAKKFATNVAQKQILYKKMRVDAVDYSPKPSFNK